MTTTERLEPPMTGTSNRHGALTPQEVLGVPVLPPGGATLATNWLRALVGRVHAAMAPPPLRILEGLFGMLDHRVLVALCESGVPDVLLRPTPVGELARRLDLDEAMLERVLRFAATRGWVRIDRRGRVHPTRVTAFLRRDHPGGWRAWVDFAGGAEIVGAVGALSLRSTSPDGFAAVNGDPFFEWMAAHPARWATFDGAMAAGARMHALVLAASLDWPEGSSVCDVGGGTGALLAALLDLRPDLQATVLDLPGVVERAVDHPRLRVIAGDAFAEVPAGHDTYLLVNVVHDWGDTDAVRILGRVAAAVGTDGRVVVVEGERTTVPRPDVAVASDLLMAALTPGGRERSVRELADLGVRAGLRHERAVRLASGDLAHVLVPAAGGSGR